MKLYIMAAVMLFVANVAQAQTVFKIEDHPQAHCMALNVYYEARGSNLADKYAVSDVVLNRVRDPRYPNTICEVVKQGVQDSNGNMIRNKCQFSWYCDGKNDNPQNEDLWKESQIVAWSIITWDKHRGITEGATHYHATYVNPRWAKTLQLVGRIGAHIFYRWE
jgi:spore germination cell wall hydrolase CwlJ-like protein